MITAFPLSWPEGQPRTQAWKRQNARFDTTQDRAQSCLMMEIARLGGKEVVLSTNIELRNDGMPRARQQRVADDPGVAVYFSYKGRQMCFACDKWDLLKDNMQAIRKTIEALRGIERWGSGDMMERAFTGFTALASPTAKRHWTDVIGCRADEPLEFIERRYRVVAKEAHPDFGGSHERMAELNEAIAQARKEKQ